VRADRRQHGLDVFGQHMVAALHRGPAARGLQQRDRGARREAFGEHAVLPRGVHQACT
jgi:hypothetical protein